MYKSVILKRIIICALWIAGLALLSTVQCKAEDTLFTFGETTIKLPLKIVEGVQLYSFEEGRGYPAVQTILAERKNFRLAFGAAAVLGTSANVPFVALQTRLSPAFFDISGNNLFFGAWVGRQSSPNETRYGLSCSIPLW